MAAQSATRWESGFDDDRFSRRARSRVGAPRRLRALRDGRLFRGEGKFAQAARAGVEGARVHRPWQVDGRLGEPPQADARTRLRDRAPRRARRGARRRRRHELFPRQLSVALFDRSDRCAAGDGCRFTHELDRDLAEVRAQWRFSECLRHRVAIRVHASAPAHLSRRRRGAAARARRRRARLAPRRRALERARSRRGGERRRRRVVERHVLPVRSDGGVARLRVHGDVVPDWRRAGGLSNELDLAAAENGGDVVSCSDMFFGPKHNLIMPGRAHNMSDGWETRRRRGPGHDWVIVQLATEAVVRRIEVDTNHFKGNYPDTASIEAVIDGEWRDIVPRTKLMAHTRHMFLDINRGPVAQLRLNVFPDGGVSRLRVHAVATEAGRQAAVVRRINTLADATAELRSTCGSAEWVRKMAAARPFASWDALVRAADDAWWD